MPFIIQRLLKPLALHRLFLVAALILPITAHCHAAEPAPQEYDPARFEKTVITTGLIQPMEMAIAPDGTIYLIELAGNIKAIDPKTSRVQSIGKLAVTTEQENGLIGIALDPNFEINRWMYLQYSPPDFIGQHISRFRVNEDGQLDAGSEVLILKFEEQRKECCHHAGSMEFGPDGCLYIGTGDNTNPFGDSQGFAPIDERDERGAFNALRTSANTMSHNGKILRIRPRPEGGYDIPDGNLFSKDGSQGLPEIYVMGCRNPWRLNIDPKTGFLYWGDVGPDAGGDGQRGPRGYDEVNQARKAGNFGWPLFIGNNQPYLRVDFASGSIGETFDPSSPVNFSRFNSGAKNLPPAVGAWIYYPGGPSKEFPALGSGGRTACAGPVYDFDPNNPSALKFPANFQRTLFIYEWSRSWIVAVHLDADSNIQSMERFMPNESFIRPIDLQFDKDGALLVIEYGETWGVNPDARLVRVEYQSGNRSPKARVSSSNRFGREPLAVRFSASDSSDKDLEPLTFAWTATDASDANKRQQLGEGSDVEWTFEAPGIYNVQVTATDRSGATDTAVVPVIVGNAMPEIRFLSPRDGDFYDPKQGVAYQITVTDAEDGSSDDTVVASTDLDSLDPSAPDRVLVEAKLFSSLNTANDQAAVAPGLKLMRSSDCFNCHALDRAIVGPSFLDVANKYRDQAGAMQRSIERVLKGSTGVWGKVAMLPHSQHTEEQIASMVEWVYAAQPDPSSKSSRGMSNHFLLPDKPEFASSLVRLTANYTDLGREGIPSLTGSTTIQLLPRMREAENADAIHRMSELGSHNASNGKFLGSIDHGAYVVFKDVPMAQVGSATFRVTSAGAGGDIVVRAGSLEGRELGRIKVEVNGSWDAWYERTAELARSSERCDLYFEAVNPTNRSALMNIDWIRLDP
ncbi:MAG: PQQ-dependent sugar dehydrogenase [Planctomycetes bacterium]|nr:PQQ-dependent sugar dehydrogenase [Planctomycetota bacterium]